ncbi:MAG: hypothetical protein D6761_09520 [Candidatus Dadabacteria bacterium]|nr:MAG: hypothetical protein D6761_09520 [Candidatus Dadabacteria bacterium]
MGMPMSLEEDVRELKERVAYLDGWREGEANRYARLEADMAQVKEELHRLGDKIASQDERLSSRIDRLDERLDGTNQRIDRMMWFMLATLGGVLTNLVLTVLK